MSRQGSGSYVTAAPDDAVLRFVPVGSIADIQRCFEFRVGLEGAAAALAAERWQSDDLAEIRSAYEALETCIRTGQLGVDADARFHQAIARATHNHYHVSVQLSLQAHIALGMNLTRNLSMLRTDARLRLVQDEHSAILAAIEARDGGGRAGGHGNRISRTRAGACSKARPTKRIGDERCGRHPRS